MSRSLKILERATSDVEQIFGWIEERSPQGAINWYNAFFDTVHTIAANPASFAVAPEALPRWKRNIRQALFRTARGNRYRIVFELTADEILILRVRGPGQPPLSRRDLPGK